MALPVAGQVGEANLSNGATQTFRQGPQGDQIVSDLHGRFYEQNRSGRLFGAGMTLTSISNATFTTATLSATGTPVLGIWNPINSGVNAVILQAALDVIVTAATNTGPGSFQWCSITGQQAPITTALQAWNRRTLVQSGAQVRNVTGVALTGLTNNLVVMQGSSLGGGSLANFSFVGTAAGQVTPRSPSFENLDGSLIVPPGAILALLCSTTPVAHSAASSLFWEEIPV